MSDGFVLGAPPQGFVLGPQPGFVLGTPPEQLTLPEASPEITVDVPEPLSPAVSTAVAQPPPSPIIPALGMHRLRSQVAPPEPIKVDTPRLAARAAVANIKSPDLIKQMRDFVETGEINDSPVLRDALKFVVPQEADSRR